MQIIRGQITKNFNLEEFVCNNARELLITPETVLHMQRLQKLREWYNRPIKINSGYRTKEYNARVGGSPKSQHVLGLATDIALPGEFYSFADGRKEQFLNNVKDYWLDLCKKDGIAGGVGFYDTFIHLDSRVSKTAFWDNRTK